MPSRALQQGWMTGVLPRVASAVLSLTVVLAASVPATQLARAQTLTVLHSFTGTGDGANPRGVLVRDPAGNLYGTTLNGGHFACNTFFHGCGTVFKLDTTGTETVLHNFGAAGDGAFPLAGLILDPSGNLYGTTIYGGASGPGTVFEVRTTGKEVVLYSFSGIGGDEQGYPYGGLILDPSGNLYGTTYAYGASGDGTVFELEKTGRESILHSFTGRVGRDGAQPIAGLIRDPAGNLYGTTSRGGASDLGTVFKLDTTGKETVLHSFTGTPRDGRHPAAGLIQDEVGNLYGTTILGGAFGYGTVFKLDTTGTETVLYSFTGRGGGANPLAGLIRDASGNLYGTTQLGGAADFGTVFRLDTTGKETVLHAFNRSDGAHPVAGLLRDPSGNLYGTTVEGGAFGHGTVFKLTPQ